MEFNKRKYFKGTFDPFWRETKVLPGGFALDDAQTLPSGAVVRPGELAEVDFDNRSCKLLKLTEVLEISGTTVKVPKGSLLVAGETVTDAETTATISSVDTSEQGYDTLTLDTAVTGDSVYLTDVAPNMVVADECVNDGKAAVTITLAYEALILYKALPTMPTKAAWNLGLLLSNNPSIKFITQ